MSFRDEITADIAGIFFQEFATSHRVEGATILCVVDTNRGKLKSDGGAYGLSEADFVLYAKTEDLPPRKAAGALLNLDGRELTVGAWDEQDGVVEIELYAPDIS